MRLKTLILCSTSAGVLALGATPAWAQQPSAPEPSTQQAQEQPADPEAGPAQADDAVQGADGADTGEEIVVTGLRRSLQSAQNIKRNSEQIVDAIVAEDIGKLPDLSVAETAARIPGVTVLRRAGEANGVLVRGLPDFSTTYNGREIFTAETRVVALQDFPSANIAALEVFKNSTANLVEAGLAGLINVRSRRPFDFKGTELAGSAWALYTKQAGEWNPNFNLLASTRWDTGIGEMGFLINVSRTELDYYDSEPSNTDFLQTFRQGPGTSLIDDPAAGKAARFPDIQRVFYRSGNRVRPSVNAAFQWRPSDTLEIYAEALYQGFRNKISDRRFDVPLYNGAAYNLNFRSGTNLLDSGSVTGLGDRIFTFQGATFNKTDTYQFAVGGVYEQGPLKVSVDLARTDTEFTGSTESVDRRLNGQAGTTVNFDLLTPQFEVSGVDVTNPANWVFTGLFEQNQRSEGDDYQARIDSEYDLIGTGFLRNLQVGLRYTDRDAVRAFGQRFGGTPDIPSASLPLEYEVFRPGFRGTDVQSGLRTWVTPTYASIRNNVEELRGIVRANAGCCDAGSFTTDPVAFDPVQSYTASEKTFAGYAQLNATFGEDVDATVGIRGVRTRSRLNGTANVAGVLTPVSVGNSYTDWLPNASLLWRARPNLQFRLSAAQTRTRPNFQDLNPGGSLGPPDPLAGGRRTGSTGNPFLRPFTSNNYDFSAEYYFSRTGLAALALFRKDLNGFIQPNTVEYEDPELGPLRITGPVNTRSGRIQGFEAQFSTFFEWDWVPEFARNFGFQANYTYLDGETEFVNPHTGETERGVIVFPEADPATDLGGLSKHTVNLVGMYEGGGFSARLSYNLRGEFLDRRDFRGPGGPQNASNRDRDVYLEFGEPAPRLDLSTSYTVNDNLTVFFDWTNILEKPLETYLSSARNGEPRADYIRFLRYEETTFSLGVRVRM
jgi:TonB-dependent receptor